jgi:orotate phosphoribosyltransferase
MVRVTSERDATTANRAQLLELLARRSYQRKEQGFTLSSGRTSEHYVDCKQTTLDPEGSYLSGLLLFQSIKSLDIEAIAGLTMGADPLVTAVTLVSHLEKKPIKALIVRKTIKQHGLSKWVEGPMQSVRRVVVVDDVVTTGKSTISAIDHLREEGLEVSHVVALVDRQEGGKEEIESRKVSFKALFTLDDILAHVRRHP